MDFEEKIDAMRMTLELAIHDIEALRALAQEHRAAIEEQRVMAALDRENIHGLVEGAGRLLQIAQEHDLRIGKLEGQRNA